MRRFLRAIKNAVRRWLARLAEENEKHHGAGGVRDCCSVNRGQIRRR